MASRCCTVRGAAGFSGAPVSKALVYVAVLGYALQRVLTSHLASIGVLSAPASDGVSSEVMGEILGNEVNNALRTIGVEQNAALPTLHSFDLRSATLFQWSTAHHFIFSQVVFATFAETLAGCSLLYAMRNLERFMSSPKFALLGVATSVGATIVHAALLAIGGDAFGVVVVAAGPYALLFTLLALYIQLVPLLQPRLVVLCGRVALSEKTPVVLLAIQLLLCRGYASLAAGLAGASVGAALNLPLWLRRAALRGAAQRVVDAPTALSTASSTASTTTSMNPACARIMALCGITEGGRPWDELLALVRHPTDGFRDGRLRRGCAALRVLVDALPPVSARDAGELSGTTTTGAARAALNVRRRREQSELFDALTQQWSGTTRGSQTALARVLRNFPQFRSVATGREAEEEEASQRDAALEGGQLGGIGAPSRAASGEGFKTTVTFHANTFSQFDSLPPIHLVHVSPTQRRCSRWRRRRCGRCAAAAEQRSDCAACGNGLLSPSSRRGSPPRRRQS